MPQCDPTFALSEVFWLFLTWGCVFLCLKLYAWPTILKRQAQRNAKHQKWVDAAVQRQAQALEWQAFYQTALDVAHTAGRAHVHDELANFDKEAEKVRHAFLASQTFEPVKAKDVKDVKEALSDWKEACLKILPFSSH